MAMRMHVLLQKRPPLLPLAKSSPLDLDQSLRSDQLVLGLLKHQEEIGLQDQQKDQDEQTQMIYLPLIDYIISSLIIQFNGIFEQFERGNLQT